MKKKNVCKECKRPLNISQKRNKDGELPFELKLELSNENMRELKKGSELWWQIRDKRKIGYCEIWVKKSHKKTQAKS